MKRILLLALFIISATTASAKLLDTIYYNKDWKIIKDRSQMAFYRLAERMPDGIYKVSDHYRDNRLQMEGFVKDPYSLDFYASHHGYVKYYDDKGNISAEGNYKNGKRDGEWKDRFDGTDHLKFIRWYKNDMVNGAFVVYDSATGSILGKGQCVDGLYTGVWDYYFEGTTTRRSQITYVKDEREGLAIYYDSTTGAKTKEGINKHNKAEGVWKIYWGPQSQLLREETYKNDVINGLVKGYDSFTHKLTTVGQYAVGFRTGDWKFYNASGQLYGIETYQPGSTVIKYVYNDPITGEKQIAGTFKDGHNDGLVTSYYRFDKVQCKLNYKNGYLTGKSLYYDSLTGQMTKETYWDKNIRIGTWKYYTTTGKLLGEENYKKGVLDGELKIYDSLGIVYISRYYKEGKKHGKTRINYPYTKQLWIDCNVTADSMEGDLKAYYPSGKLKRKEVYNNGALVSSVCYSEPGEEIAYTPLIIQCHFDGDVMTYIGDNLKYPEDAAAAGIEGKVIVNFVVNESGLVSDVNVVNSVDERLDKEAMRLVSQMPPWIPSRIDGQAYKEYKSLPIVFWKH